MELDRAVQERRSYRALEPVEITDDVVDILAGYAGLAPSCYNNQPWRFVFVRSPEKLEEMHTALSRGNSWATRASMIIAVLSREEDDCVIGDRQYHQFDTGMATALMLLKATDMGLVAHPIAGYNPEKTREILGIPEDVEVLTLVIVGKHSDDRTLLNEDQSKVEDTRPEREPTSSYAYKEVYKG